MPALFFIMCCNNTLTLPPVDTNAGDMVIVPYAPTTTGDTFDLVLDYLGNQVTISTIGQQGVQLSFPSAKLNPFFTHNGKLYRNGVEITIEQQGTTYDWFSFQTLRKL